VRGWLGLGFIGIFVCVGLGAVVADPTGAFGWCWLVTLALVLALVFAASGRREKLRADGIAAPAYVLQAEDVGLRINDNPVVRVRWRIHPPGQPPFETESRETVPLTALGRLSAGQPFTIHLDPKVHTNFTVDWSITPVAPDDDARRSDGPPRDVTERLQRIDSLRSAGVITDAEYAEQRSRILGEL
jgi:hypothetical protein